MMLQPLDGADGFAGVLILQFFFMEDGFVLGLSAYGTTHGTLGIFCHAGYRGVPRQVVERESSLC